MSVGGSTVVADGWGWRFGASPSSSVDGVSFTINEGERVLLLGPSGSGKSTLLRALAGLLASDEGTASGTLSIDGQDARAQVARVGYVLQDPETQAVLQRVGDDVAFGCENFGVAEDQIWSRVSSSLELVGLNIPLDHSTTALSGGQKQRLALAGALATEPRLLLLDEPTANLDSAGAELVRTSVQRVAHTSGATVIVVEHRLDLWWDFADRVIVLTADGQILADASPRDILSAQRAQLESAGIWLPGFSPQTLDLSTGGECVISTRHLLSARPGSQAVSEAVTLDVHAGELVAVTGPNGVGKTALALTLGGLIAPYAGEITPGATLSRGLRGEPIEWPSRRLHTRIGNVFQSPSHQFVRATVREELALSAKTADLRGRELQNAVDDMLSRLGLVSSADAHPFALSGGQQRRLSVATALISKPTLLVLDEPTFGQDAATWQELVSLMGEVCGQGRAIVAMTHDPHLTEVATREHVLRGAQLPTGGFHA